MKRDRYVLILIICLLSNTDYILLGDNLPFKLNALLNFSEEITHAYPNPFNESTTIFYSPPKNEFLIVKLYNNKGQLLTSIFEDDVEKGESYRFELDGSNLKPGTYYYTIEADGSITHQRIELVR